MHVVEPGETLSEIAYLYHLDFSKLALYNNLPNPNAIHPGQRLLIPSFKNEGTIKSAALPKSERLSVVNQAEPGQRIRIAVDKQTDGRTVTAHFTLEQGQEDGYASYEWDLGDGRKSFRESTFWTYEKPGTYTVSLKAWDDDGRLHLSNRIYLDVPHPGTWRSGDQRFVTLDDVGEPFEVDGEVVEVLGYPSVAESPIAAAGAENGLYSYSANAGGFFNLTVDRAGERSRLYLFVSPVPSRHADRADLDWYRTQFNTGTQSNCGPSMVSMALAWATGDYVPVAKVREMVGWQGDGGIGFEDMIRVLSSQGVTAWMQTGFEGRGRGRDHRLGPDRRAAVQHALGAPGERRRHAQPLRRLLHRRRRPLRGGEGLQPRPQVARGVRPDPQRLEREQRALRGRHQHDRQEPLLPCRGAVRYHPAAERAGDRPARSRPPISPPEPSARPWSRTGNSHPSAPTAVFQSPKTRLTYAWYCARIPRVRFMHTVRYQ